MSHHNHFHKAVITGRFLSFKLLLFTFLFMLASLRLPAAYAAQVQLLWDPNSEPQLAGYNIYYGTESRNYTFKADAGNKTSYTIPDLDAGKQYFFAATAYDALGNESAFSVEVSCNIPVGTATTTIPAGTTTSIPDGGSSGSMAPVAHAGDDRTITLGTIISLDGERSYDPDGGTLQYTWEVLAGPASYILQNSTTVSPTFKASEAGVYEISLRVCDGLCYSAPDSVIITVKSKTSGTGGTGTGGGSGGSGDDSITPVADAGADQTGKPGDVIILDGSKSHAPEDVPLMYSWQQISGSAVMLEDSETPTPSFTALEEGSCEFELVVSDGVLESAPDRVRVKIVNEPGGKKINLRGPKNNEAVSDTLVFEWEGDAFDMYKIQISKDGSRFFAIGMTRKQSFTLNKFFINLISTSTLTPVYWRVMGKEFGTDSWVVSDTQVFYVVNNSYGEGAEKIKEALEKMLLLFEVIVAP